MMSINLNDIAILNIWGVGYDCIINRIGKFDKRDRRIIRIKKIIAIYKEGKEIITFANIETKSTNFTSTKNPFKYMMYKSR